MHQASDDDTNNSMIINFCVFLICVDMEDEGGFVLRKLVKEKDADTDNQQLFNNVTRSLDFPPGLVDVDNPTPAKGRWKELIKIVESEKKKLSARIK